MIAEAIRHAFTDIQKAGFDKPISMEVDGRTASALQNDLAAMLEYGSMSPMLHHNECIFNEVMIIAPKNFIWRP